MWRRASRSKQSAGVEGEGNERERRPLRRNCSFFAHDDFNTIPTHQSEDNLDKSPRDNISNNTVDIDASYDRHERRDNVCSCSGTLSTSLHTAEQSSLCRSSLSSMSSSTRKISSVSNSSSSSVTNSHSPSTSQSSSTPVQSSPYFSSSFFGSSFPLFSFSSSSNSDDNDSSSSTSYSFGSTPNTITGESNNTEGANRDSNSEAGTCRFFDSNPESSENINDIRNLVANDTLVSTRTNTTTSSTTPGNGTSSTTCRSSHSDGSREISGSHVSNKNRATSKDSHSEIDMMSDERDIPGSSFEGFKNTDEKNEQKRRKDAESFKNLGNESYKRGMLESAIDHYTQAINRFPNDSVYYQNRALCYRKQQKWRKALNDAQMASALDLKNLKAFFVMGEALIHLGEVDEGLKMLERAKSLTGAQTSFLTDIDDTIRKGKKMKWIQQNNQKKKKRKDLEKFMKECVSMLVDASKIDINVAKTRISEIEEAFDDLRETDEPFESPHFLQCKIAMGLMKDPVVTASGFTYERAVIEEHLRRNGKFDPISRKRFAHDPLYCNYLAKEATEWFLDKYPWMYED